MRSSEPTRIKVERACRATAHMDRESKFHHSWAALKASVISDPHLVKKLVHTRM